MPQLNKKATQAKQQWSTSRTYFISTPEDIDSGSIYSSESSSDEASDDSSSDESVDATKRLFSKQLPSNLQPQLVCHLNFWKIIRLLTWLLNRLWVSTRGPWSTGRTLKGLVTATRNTEEASQGSGNIGSFSTLKSSQLMLKLEMHVNMDDVTLQPDPVKEMAVDLQELETIELKNNWCCMYHILLLQEDFANEKSMLQHYIEGRGQICMFLPKFHYKLNPIKWNASTCATPQWFDASSAKHGAIWTHIHMCFISCSWCAGQLFTLRIQKGAQCTADCFCCQKIQISLQGWTPRWHDSSNTIIDT